jgi:Secretion system C-terminal sorting domain
MKTMIRFLTIMGFVFAGLLFNFHFIFAQSGWYWSNPEPIGNPLHAVSFTDANTGTAVGDYGTILRTTNGGASWTSQPSRTTNSLYSVSFTDANTGTAVGFGGTILRTTTGGVATGMKEMSSHTPSDFSLTQNYPNPFNPTTVISYQIPLYKGGLRGIYVTLKVYDLLGREVATLVNERKDAGTYSVQWNASGFTTGMYLVRIQAGSFIDTKKVLLMK